MTVNRNQFLPLLEPILRDVVNDARFPRREKIAMRLYDQTVTSGKAEETLFERAGLGDFQVKVEGGPISFTDPISGVTIKFTHVRYANGYKVTQEMLDQDQYDEIRKLEIDLRIAADDFLEVEGHRLLNGGFGTTNVNGFRATGFDGLSLFSTAHTRLDAGATQANRPATDVILGWTALSAAVQQFQLWRDHRGRRVLSRPRELWVHPNDEPSGKELLGSSLKPGTANNEMNVLSGALSLMVSPYITGTDDWFIKGDITDAYWFWDTSAGVRSETLPYDEINEIAQRKAVTGFSMGAATWYGWYGTSGAA
jgi:hypothetical protein